MSNKNKKTVVTMEDAKKVENQEPNVTPEIPDEKGEETTGQESGEETTDKEKKFHLPKIKLPKIPLPSKKTVIEVLKSIALLLLGAITGAVAIVAAAIKVSSAEKAVDETEEEEIDEEGEPEVEEDIPDEVESETE